MNKKYLIELGNFARGYEQMWYEHWQQKGVEQVVLHPCKIDDNLSKIPRKAIPIFFDVLKLLQGRYRRNTCPLF